MRAEGLLRQTLVWTLNAIQGPLYAHIMLLRRMTIPPSEAPMVVFVPSNKSYHWKRASSVDGTFPHHRHPLRRLFHREMAQTSAVRSRLLLLRRLARTSYNLGTHSSIRPPRSFRPQRTLCALRSMTANLHNLAQLSAPRASR